MFLRANTLDVLKTRDELETTRELLEETEELLQFGSWTWEVGTNSVKWTSGLYAILDYEKQHREEKADVGSYIDHVLEDYQPAFRAALEDALRNKTDFELEYLVRTRAGTLKNISTKGKVVRDDDGEVLKILCINRDITELRTFEKEKELSIRELNRSNKDLEEFAYIASHDLQEPLRKISMFTERLQAKYDKSFDQEGQLFIERILASAANMRTLIDNLLDFSRANRRSYTYEQVDLWSVLEGVTSELELKVEEAKAAITITGTLPTVSASESEMKQLFANLLSNALKFRKHDSPARIEIHGGKVSRQEVRELGLPGAIPFVRIEVRDNGIGFEPEYSDRIFQIFQRLNGKSEYPGSGIGLAICKKIVEKHGGLIFAESEVDVGSVFTVILPENRM